LLAVDHQIACTRIAVERHAHAARIGDGARAEPPHEGLVNVPVDDASGAEGSVRPVQLLVRRLDSRRTPRIRGSRVDDGEVVAAPPQLAHDVDNLAGARPAADEIATLDDEVGGDTFQVVEDGFERSEIGVDVGDYGDAQSREGSYTPTRSRRGFAVRWSKTL